MNEMSHSLQSNIDVLNHIASESAKRETLEGDIDPASTELYAHFRDSINTTVVEQTFLKQQADRIRSIADRRAGQVSQS